MKPTSALTKAGHLSGCSRNLCENPFTPALSPDLPQLTYAGALDFIAAMRGPLSSTPYVGACAEVLEFLRPAVEAGIVARGFVAVGLPLDMVILAPKALVGCGCFWEPSEVRVVRVLGFSRL